MAMGKRPRSLWIRGSMWRVFAETDEPLEGVTPLYIEKHRLHSGKQVLTVRTSREAGNCGAGPVSQED